MTPARDAADPARGTTPSGQVPPPGRDPREFSLFTPAVEPGTPTGQGRRDHPDDPGAEVAKVTPPPASASPPPGSIPPGSIPPGSTPPGSTPPAWTPSASTPSAPTPEFVPAPQPEAEIASQVVPSDAFSSAGPGFAPGAAFEPLDQTESLSPPLVELAHAYGVATEFWDWRGQHTQVSRSTIVTVLTALEVPATDEQEIARSLADVRDLPWRRVLPAVTVIRQGRAARVPVHVPHGTAVEVRVELEDGGVRDLVQEDRWVDPREVDGRPIGEASFTLPADLPLGWHRLVARHIEGQADRPLVVTPARLELPPSLVDGRGWGFMTQLYSVRSQLSWGLGDLADLTELASWSARQHGADFVLVNPLHAAEVVPPMQASPYLPVTRRFVNPVYLRVEDIREIGYMPSADRALIEWSAEAMRGLNTDPGELDRDAVWEAKKAALETVFNQPRSPARQAALEAFCEREGEGLLDFATWCALSERYGTSMAHWPAHALDPRSLAVASLREELADRVAFYMWLQWCLDEQLAAAQREAVESGMEFGIVHDLAVGVHPEGADVWSLGDALARYVTVGAPPDAFNQQGQDWSQPPWRPDRLAELGYAPYRDMLRTVLRHAGGLRVDHIIGLFRLWWVPNGVGPDQGTYVRYDHEALIGILALEAHRAGAFVVGEDLGTVEPWARDYLRERGLLGTSILWFERDGEGRPLRPENYRELCLATITTHDLPPTAGYLAGEHIELRDRLGLLTRSVQEETEVDEGERAAVMDLLTELGLLGENPTERDRVEALHRFLTRTPARLLGVALADATGDRRAMNQPGTNTEYPNWRLPLADGAGDPVLLEEVMTSVRSDALSRTVNGR